MKIRDIVTKVYEYDSVDELSSEDKVLVEEAKNAATKAYSPYSKFQVGAALRLANGTVIRGNNQENAAYPSGLCAERVALFYANAEYPNEAVESLAVTVIVNNKYINEPIPPCGACRQVIVETEKRFKKPIKIIMAGQNRIDVVENAMALLPFSFDESFLI